MGLVGEVGGIEKPSSDAVVVAAVAGGMHSEGLGTEDSRICSAAFALGVARTYAHVVHDFATKLPMLENWIVGYDIHFADMGGQPP